MSPHLHELIVTYGYWLMAFGALIEGETFLLAGGIAAQQGILHLPGLLLLALVGSFVHDVCFFLIGRFFGDHYFKKKPQFMAKADVVFRFAERWGVGLIIALRFAYGLRTIIPIVLGMTSISIRKFLFYDLIGGILWSCTFILGGYFLGKAFEHALRMLGEYESLALQVLTITAIVAVGVVALWFSIKKRRARKRLILAVKEKPDAGE